MLSGIPLPFFYNLSHTRLRDPGEMKYAHSL